MIKFSDHAMMKLEILQRHGINVDLSFVEQTLSSPEKRAEGYSGRKIAQCKLDAQHVFRVVYEEQGEDLLVITFYPARRERYEQD